MTKFDEHLASKDFGGSTDADIDIARAAWNAGVRAAKTEIAGRFDELEPWIEPSDLDHLLELKE